MTSISGKVYDPAGKVPLYGITVFIPNAPLSDISDGASCLPCATATSGDPIVEATTDAMGAFKLDNVPVGTDIPFVMQVGKWRRQTTISTVTACIDNAVSDVNVTRLPRNRTEGHIPKIALTTGGADALECLLRKIGIEDSEFTPETADGRVNLFAAGTHNGTPLTDNGMTSTAGTNAYMTLNGAAKFTDSELWWESADNLMKYDLLLHSCEGQDTTTNKSAAALAAFQNYANMGGRAFASHWHVNWIDKAPAPFPTVATFTHNAQNPPSPFTTTIDTSFQKGMDLAAWLMSVGASTTLGQLEIRGGRHTVNAVNTMVAANTLAPISQRWIYSTSPASVQYFSFNTPINPPMGQAQCGKVVFSDLHVSAGSGMVTDDDSDPTLPFPVGCRTTELSPQEKALEFMLFDLSACTKPGIP
jgi:hypothetical protein